MSFLEMNGRVCYDQGSDPGEIDAYYPSFWH